MSSQHGSELSLTQSAIICLEDRTLNNASPTAPVNGQPVVVSLL